MGCNDLSVLLAVFRENYQELLRFLTRRTGDAERAAELAQDTFVRLSAMSAATVDIENPRAFVYRVAGNLAIDAMRRDGRLRATFIAPDAGDHVPDAAATPEGVALARDQLRRLEAALDELPPNPRLALLLNRVEGRTFAEIARHLGVSQSMVAKYLAQALRHCRDRMREGADE